MMISFVCLFVARLLVYSPANAVALK